MAGAAAWVVADLRLAAGASRLFPWAEVPPRPVGLVLGCSPTLRDGRENLFFRHRIECAAALFHSGKVRVLLLSGDHSRPEYDEPGAMRQALHDLGVPPEGMVLDYAGFSTFDSMVRARDVFGLDSLIVVSQRSHALRALYLADALGIDAVGAEAKDVGRQAGIRTKTREALARVRTLLDVHFWGRQPKFLGPRVHVFGTEQERS